jgi:diguanylate cyclase (GGDEF)-like protein
VQKPLGGPDGGPKGNDCLVVIYTKEPTLLGRRFVLDTSPIRIGRGAENHIVLEGDSVSRRHAHFEQRSGAWWCVDDGSTNGSYVNDDQIMREARLGNGDRIKIGPTIFKFLSGQDVEAQYHEEIYRMTIIDGLTQVHVKRYLLEALDKELMRARRHVRELSFLMIDIDHFKKINDVHGHLAGDYVLKEVAKHMQQRIRRDEVLARYGGEEFAIILPETNLEGGLALAEGLREKIEQSRFVFQGETIRVTISAGAAMLDEADRASTDLIRRADEKLYEAKRAGRNRVIA